MGVSSSTELPPALSEVPSWPFSRAQSIVKAYLDGEYDFGIDYTVVMSITGLGMDAAKAMTDLHIKNTGAEAKPGNQSINAMTFLITIISLADKTSRNENGRLQAIFSLFDFNKRGSISADELTIMLLCVSSSYSFILQRTDDVPVDSTIIKATQNVYNKKNKKPNTQITKDELQSFASNFLWKEGLNNIDSIFDALRMELEIGTSEDTEEAAAGTPSKGKK